jgi:hypothetical protein
MHWIATATTCGSFAIIETERRQKLLTYTVEISEGRPSMYKSYPHGLIASVRYDSFAYLTSRIRLTPKDLLNTHLETPTYLHFICSPQRASEILSEVDEVEGWDPRCVYEPIPVGLFR